MGKEIGSIVGAEGENKKIELAWTRSIISIHSFGLLDLMKVMRGLYYIIVVWSLYIFTIPHGRGTRLHQPLLSSHL